MGRQDAQRAAQRNAQRRMTATPLTQAQKVQRSQAALAARGGRRLHVSLQPEVAHALDALVASGYAHTASAAIAKALLQAHSKSSRPA